MKKVIVVSASWCSQCGPYKKALEQAGIEYQSFDADNPDNEQFLMERGVRGLPTTLVYDGGVHISTVVGNNVPKVKELLSEG